MKILHVITGLAVGGAETALCRQIESLSGPDYCHSVVCLGIEDSLSSRIRRTGANLYHLKLRSGLAALPASLTLRRILQNERADIIHGWMYHANIAATLATFRRHDRLIWGIRCSADGIVHEKWTTRLVATMGAKLSGSPQTIVYNSTASARSHETIGYSPNKSRVIPNGFDTTAFRPNFTARHRIREELHIAPKAFVVGLIARWHPVKDHASFLNAAARFLKHCEDAIFVLAGDNVDNNNITLMRMAHDLGLHDHLRLCGRRDDTAALMSALDVGCSSSAWGEAFPNVVGEMMACAVPCVATDLGDVREIIGETGFVVPSKDSAALSARWLDLLLMGEEIRRSLGHGARQRIVARYSLATCAAAYVELYRQTIGSDDVRHNRPLGISSDTTPGGP